MNSTFQGVCVASVTPMTAEGDVDYGTLAAFTDLRGFSWWGFAAGFMTYLAPNSSAPDHVQASYHCVNDGFNPPCVGGQLPLLMGPGASIPAGCRKPLIENAETLGPVRK